MVGKIEIEIVGTENHYYKIGDKIRPKFKDEKDHPISVLMSINFYAISEDKKIISLNGQYGHNRTITEDIAEGYYWVTTFELTNDKYYYHYMGDEENRYFYVLRNKPKAPEIAVDAPVGSKTATCIITPTSYACDKGEIVWGDGNTEEISKKDREPSFVIKHTYDKNGLYTIRVTLINAIDLKTPPKDGQIFITDDKPEEFEIINTEQKYYKSGDDLNPIVKSESTHFSDDMIQTLETTSTSGTPIMIHEQNFLKSRVISSDRNEGLYTVENWEIYNKRTRYRYFKNNIKFYILKIPKIPKLETNISNFIVTLKIIPTSLGCVTAIINWGDELSDTITKKEEEEFFEIKHEYKNNGQYNITVEIINIVKMHSPIATKKIIIGEIAPLIKHDTIYLIEDSVIIKPLIGNYQLNFTLYNTSGNISMNRDDEIKAGMQIYLYHFFPQLFIIESVSHNDKETNIIITDYLSGLLNGRICYNGTKENDGYRIYEGTADKVIPEIITDNLGENRGDSTILLSDFINNNTKLIIKARYQNVLSILQDALIQSNTAIISQVISINPTIVLISFNQEKIKNINLTKERNCGEIRNKNLLKLPNVALVAGRGEGAKRNTAWRGNIDVINAQRVEVFVDGGVSTETTFLDKQEGNTCNWNFSLKSPYNLFSDFWINDNIYINGEKMKVTKIDYAKSSSGETCVITLGYGVTTADKAILNIDNGIVKNYS